MLSPRSSAFALAALALAAPASPGQDERGPFRLEWRCPADSIVRVQAVWRDERFEVRRTAWHDGAGLAPKGPGPGPFLEYWQSQKSRTFFDEVADVAVLAMPPDDVRLGDRWHVRVRFGDLLEIEGSSKLDRWTTALGSSCLEVTGLFDVRPLAEVPDPGPYAARFRSATLTTRSRIDPARGLVLTARCGVAALFRKPSGEESPVEGTWDYELAGIDRHDEGDLGERSKRAVERAVAWLEAQQRPDGSYVVTWADPVGRTPLVLVALLEAGTDPERPSVRKGFEFLEKIELRDTEDQAELVLALAAWGGERPRLEKAVLKLLAARRARTGGWGYFLEGEEEGPVDLRSTAMALEALAAAAGKGIEVPAEVWKTPLPLYLDRQDPPGAEEGRPWRSEPGELLASARLTAAAVLGLATLRDRAGDLDPATAERIAGSLRGGLAWLDGHRPVYEETAAGASWQLEHFADLAMDGRAFARAAGRHPSGGYHHRLLLSCQRPDGSWQGGNPQTPWAIRYLVATGR